MRTELQNFLCERRRRARRSARAVSGWSSAARAERRALPLLVALMLVLFLALATPPANAHIVQPEKLHPVAESYRRVSFILNVIPVAWDQVDPEIVALADYWRTIDAPTADSFLNEGRAIIAKATIKADPEKGIEPMPRRQAASQVFELCT